MPGSARLISLFLEGLSNKSLHTNLYGRRHDTLNECLKDAIDFYDNYDLYGNVNKKVNSFNASSNNQSGKTDEAAPIKVDFIADLVIQKVN